MHGITNRNQMQLLFYTGMHSFKLPLHPILFQIVHMKSRTCLYTCLNQTTMTTIYKSLILVKGKSGCTLLNYSLNVLMMYMIKTVHLMITGSTSGINTILSRLETCPNGFQTRKKISNHIQLQKQQTSVLKISTKRNTGHTLL